MKTREDILSILFEMVDSASIRSRDYQDLCDRFSVAYESERAYIALEAYKQALVDVTEKIKDANDSHKKGSNLPKRRSR